MKLNISACSDRGHLRDLNEDMLSVGGILVRDDSFTLPVSLDEDALFYLFVSDGMGGHEKGEYASRYLLEHLRDSFTMGDISADGFEDQIRLNVRYVSDKLNYRAKFEGQAHPMGCTLSGVVWVRDKVFLVNAGDSRTYRFRDGMLRQLSKDETERGMTGSPDGSKLLLNCIGGGSFGRLMVDDISDKLLVGDTILICSDGLSDVCGDEEMEALLSASSDSARELVAAANRRGGPDNISIITATSSQ